MLSVTWREKNLRMYYGCYMGAIDGIEGKQLKDAYRTFQRMVGIPSDGIYGSQTETALLTNIKAIQVKLNSHGYNLAVDGLAGNSTENAVADFQSKNGLVVDKIVGNATMNKLNETPSHYECKYFKDSEFACPCCGLNLQKDGIKRIADEIREHFGQPAIITSGTRCAKHNKEVGGVSNSWHLYGNAIDLVVQGISGQQLLNFCQEIVNRGSARYTYLISGQAVHIDDGGKE